MRRTVVEKELSREIGHDGVEHGEAFARDAQAAGRGGLDHAVGAQVGDAGRIEREAGNPFDPVMARKLKNNIYAVGGSIDPEDTYKAFRGKLPDPEAMLKKKGLAMVEELAGSDA